MGENGSKLGDSRRAQQFDMASAPNQLLEALKYYEMPISGTANMCVCVCVCVVSH